MATPPNGKKPTPNPRFETSPVRCGRCKHAFEGFTLDVINDLVQLRCGNVIVVNAEMVCMECGSVFHWSIREKDLESIAHSYRQLLALVRQPYAPE